MKLSDLKIDLNKIETGIWVRNIPEMGDIELLVRPIDNPSYRRLQERLINAVPRSKRDGLSIPIDIRDEITAKCLLETVLLGWRGLRNDDATEIPFSRDLAEKLMLEPEYKSFRSAVAWAAGVAETQSAASLESDVKNS